MGVDSRLVAEWPAPSNVRAFTTLRGGPGVSLAPFDRFNLGAACGDDPAHVRLNRERLLGEFALPAAPRWLHQVHGTHVQAFNPAHVGGASAPTPTADAAITTLPNTVLAVLTADCLPVLFCNDVGTEVAAAHAGWRGLAGGILEATVQAMRSPASNRCWRGWARLPGHRLTRLARKCAMLSSPMIGALLQLSSRLATAIGWSICTRSPGNGWRMSACTASMAAACARFPIRSVSTPIAATSAPAAWPR